MLLWAVKTTFYIIWARSDFGLGLAIPGAPGDVGSRSGIGGHAAQGDYVESPVGIPIAAPVETMAWDLTGRSGDWSDTAEVGEGRLGAEAGGIITGCHEKSAGGIGADPTKGEQLGVSAMNEYGEDLVKVRDPW